MAILQARGFCTTCDTETTFSSEDEWLRDHFKCAHCGSIPRERGLMAVIEAHYPNWQNLLIHESSPCGRGASVKLAKLCKTYLSSQFYPNAALGSFIDGMRCENLEAMTFDDESIDIHVTQDVFEHILNPPAAFREIARTLRPGGAHIFTVPIVNKHKPTSPRIRLAAGEIVYLTKAEYHGNPIDERGSLVTMDWGYDLCEHIFAASGLYTQMIWIDDLSRGIRAEYIDVLVTRKPSRSEVL